MKAVVKEIQVGGGHISHDLIDACEELLDLEKNSNLPLKLNFTVILPSGKHKSITIRQDGDEIVAYGDFEGLPSILDWAREVEDGR